MNRFPRGVVSYTEAALTNTFTAEEIIITGGAFTAVANRYYQITYFEPNMSNTNAAALHVFKFRLTNLAGALQGESYNTFTTAAGGEVVTVSRIKTFSAGSTVICVTAQAFAGTGTSYVDTNNKPFLMVTDIGPA
jgi:hypothetical protein